MSTGRTGDHRSGEGAGVASGDAFRSLIIVTIERVFFRKHFVVMVQPILSLRKPLLLLAECGKVDQMPNGECVAGKWDRGLHCRQKGSDGLPVGGPG